MKLTDALIGTLAVLLPIMVPVWFVWGDTAWDNLNSIWNIGASSEQPLTVDQVGAESPGCRADDGTKVFLPEEIAPFDGTHPSGKILLVVLGQVFDVTKGKQHYGVGEDGKRSGYNIFAGIDSSRAFVSGEFDRSANYDPPLWDLSETKDTDLIAVDEWRTFYHEEKKYEFVGYLAAPDGYYTCKGERTSRLLDVERRLEKAKLEKGKNKKAAEEFPGCNSHYAQGQGGRVWCGDEAKVPRLGKLDHDEHERCACYTPQYAEKFSNKLKVYDGCSPRSSSCDIKVN